MSERERLKELLPVMAAYANGENVQFLNLINLWEDLVDADFSHSACRYRIKPKPPEPKYRPYTPEEAKKLLGKVLLHSSGNLFTATALSVNANGSLLLGMNWCTLPDLLVTNNWTIDGEPCGVEVTQ